MAIMVIDVSRQKSLIDKNIYGHFSEHLGRCIYQGLFVGENSPIPNQKGMRQDVVQALKQIRIPVLRWPGGCFADEYHWKDGIGPQLNRKSLINTHWGGVVEDNSFGTHEFLELCGQLGCEPYITGNLGSGTVQEMSEWVEYMTFGGVSPMAELRRQNGRAEAWPVKYFGLGNENWGCGGNMRPEYYADEYRRYQTYVRNYAPNKIYKIACGANSDDYNWTRVMMERAFGYMDALSLHYYTVPGKGWSEKCSALEFSTADYFETLQKTMRMEELIIKHSAIMDQFDPQKKVALIVDEWGSWYEVEPGTNPGFLYQQNTMRDAMIAAINLNLFNKHADRIRMANIAQTVNVLQAVILTEGNRMVLTPTYHVFDLFQVHQDSTLLDSTITTSMIGSTEAPIADLYESASIDAQGTVHVTLCNADPFAAREIDARMLSFRPQSVSGMVLAGEMHGHNTFDQADQIHTQLFTDVQLTAEGFTTTLPPCSVVRLSFT